MPVPKGFTLDAPASGKNLPPGFTLDAPQATPPAPVPNPTFTQEAESGLKNFGIGALKGAGSTLNALGSLVYPDALARRVSGITEAQQRARDARDRQLFAPRGTAQNVGHDAEQAGEFLIPGMGEDAAVGDAARLLPETRFLKPLLHVGFNAATGAGLNKLQGGSAARGAELGVGGSVFGQAIHAAAPGLMELTQGIDTPGRRTGKALLDETHAFTPSMVTRSANRTVNRLTPELNAAADRASASVPMDSFRNASADSLESMKAEPKKIFNAMRKMGGQLTTYANGERVPDSVTPRELLNLKRGIGHAASWKPSVARQIAGARNALYGQMNDAFETAVPEAKELNRRISALIPATMPGANYLPLRIISPIGGASIGGYEGYMRGGPEESLKGAMLGALAGAAVRPGMNASSRLMWSPITPRLTTGAALQALRPKKEKQ